MLIVYSVSIVFIIFPCFSSCWAKVYLQGDAYGGFHVPLEDLEWCTIEVGTQVIGLCHVAEYINLIPIGSCYATGDIEGNLTVVRECLCRCHIEADNSFSTVVVLVYVIYVVPIQLWMAILMRICSSFSILCLSDPVVTTLSSTSTLAPNALHEKRKTTDKAIALMIFPPLCITLTIEKKLMQK